MNFPSRHCWLYCQTESILCVPHPPPLPLVCCLRFASAYMKMENFPRTYRKIVWYCVSVFSRLLSFIIIQNNTFELFSKKKTVYVLCSITSFEKAGPEDEVVRYGRNHGRPSQSCWTENSEHVFGNEIRFSFVHSRTTYNHVGRYTHFYRDTESNMRMMVLYIFTFQPKRKKKNRWIRPEVDMYTT